MRRPGEEESGTVMRAVGGDGRESGGAGEKRVGGADTGVDLDGHAEDLNGEFGLESERLGREMGGGVGGEGGWHVDGGGGAVEKSDFDVKGIVAGDIASFEGRMDRARQRNASPELWINLHFFAARPAAVERHT